MRYPFPILALTILAGACNRVGFDALTVLGGDTGRFAAGDDSASGDTGTGGGDAVPFSSPTYLGGAEIGWAVNDVVVNGTRLFAATGAPGEELRIYEVANPTSPALLTTAPLLGAGEGLFVAPPIAYVVGQGAALELFDISVTPPQRLGMTSIADVGYAVDREGDRVYVTTAAGGDDLEIFDVTAPAFPTRLGGIELQSSYYLRGVDAVGTIAYAAGQQVWAVDVSNPAAPTVLGQGGFYWYAEDLQVVGNLVYGLESNNTGSDQLRIWDVSDPTSFDLLGAVYTSESYTRSLAVAGTTAYVVIDDYIDYLDVIDVSDPSDPRLLGYADMQTGGQSVTVAGDRVYVGLVEGPDEELRIFQRR